MIRDATEADLPRILAITNDAILHSTAVWHLVPETLETRHAWFAARRARGFPVLVAEQDGAVAGFASYGDFRPFAGYAATVENSLYVDPAAQRRGVGLALLQGLVAHATAAGLHTMVAAIEAGNAASIALHARLGFTQVGRMPEVGRKFDRWLDLVLMQRMLRRGA
jgi:phosphinothricin acetyltransferase